MPGMKLTSCQVHLFRNIIDSGEVQIQGDVTCLVGKNESGKTAMLSALYRFNPVYGDTFELNKQYPRWRMSRDRREMNLDEVDVVTCSFVLEASDVQSVNAALGEGVLAEDATYKRTIRYDGSGQSILKIDEAAARASAFDAAKAPESLRAAIGDLVDLAKVASAAEGLEVVEGSFDTEDVKRLVDVCTARLAKSESTWQRAVAIVRSRLPKFFYFGEYQSLPGRIDIRQLAGEDHPGASGIQTARALLQLASTDAGALTDEDFEDRKAELEAVSNELTDEVLEFWKQNSELSVEIDLDKVTESNGLGQTAVARFLDVRVKDKRHGFTNNFEQRSSGFQWFFSFLAAFSQFQSYPHGVVVLLDEPALTLHGRAQADFLRYINERLATKAQVVYTTHSPFMVDVSHLERVRIVEDLGPEKGAVVTSDAFGVGDDSLFPLQAALGYDIGQSLFVGPDNLVIEGTSDFTYLTVMSDHLKELGRSHLDERWRLLPAGGATNIPTFVALVGQQLDVTVLVDGSPSAVTRLKDQAGKGLLNARRLLVTDQFSDGVTPSDIEDLFTPGDYLPLYNAAFGTSLKVADLNGSDRIVARIGRATSTNFTEHGKPADVLLRTRDRVLPSLAATTLNRFEALFTAINATLS